MGASAGLLGYLAWRSLGWPLIHDAPLMHYVGWIVTQGGVPYRDVFDMNLPGAYLLHAALLAVAGPGDLAWRVFDLAWLVAICAGLWAYGRPLGNTSAIAGALLFGLYHLSGGAWRAGQRDFLLCVFLLAGALGVARSLERGFATGPLAWAGLALGAGMTVKPHAGIFWLAVALFAAWTAWRAGCPWLAPVAAVIGGGLIAPVLVFAWLGWRGGLQPFVAVLTEYVLPLYGPLGRVPLWQPFGWYRFGWAVWALLLVLALLGLSSRAPAGTEARRAIAALGAVCGALHFALQGKGWEYQLYPLALFLCALAPFALSPTPGCAGALRRWNAVSVFVAAVSLLGVKGSEAVDAPWIADKARRVALMTRDLEALAPAGATVQVMDVTEGGVHALLNAKRRQPTRFIYDFHFFHDQGDPRIQALRAQFVAALAANPPADILVLRDTWNHPGYERLREWPELEQLLARSYALAVDGDGYRIYARRPDS